jgi:ketosteroid isomerase-like protein
MAHHEMEQFIHELFAAWSSGDPDQVAPYFHRDAILRDSVNGAFCGWPAIRALYVASLDRWGEPVTEATRFWHGADGSVAFTWTMRGRVLDDRLGPEHRDTMCEFEGMTYVVVEDGLVREEIEFFDRAAPAASIGLLPTVTYTKPDNEHVRPNPHDPAETTP